MAAKSSKGKTSQSKKNKKENQKNDFKDFHGEIIILVMLCVGILLMLSNFGLCGRVGDAISGFLFGIFGFIEYILPVIVFLGVSFLISNKYSVRAIKKVCFASILLIMISVFSQMIYDIQCSEGFYLISRDCKAGGGIIGGVINKLIYSNIGTFGTFVIVITISIIMVVLLTEKSFIGAVKVGSGKVYSNVKETTKDIKKKAEDKAEEKNNRNIFESMKVLPKDENSGYKKSKKTDKAKDKSKQKNKQNEEIHEITMDIDFDEIEIEGEAFQQIYPNNDKESKVIQTSIKKPDYNENITREEKDFTNNIDSIQPISNDEEKDEIEIIKNKILKEKVVTEQKKFDNAPTLRKDQEEIKFNKEIHKKYKFPAYNLLSKGSNKKTGNDGSVKETAIKLKSTLANFGVNVSITNVSCGPTVTRYEMQPEMGVKVSKILSLQDDIKLNLAAADIRIEAPIPGKAAIGIEVPNKENTTVAFRDLIENDDFRKFPSDLAFAVGKDIGGKVVVTDISKMPHLLIAGATGSGKSVCINTLIMSLLYKSSPEDVKLIMIDPKVVELVAYNGIPHLLIPVVTDPKKAAGALNWAVAEMTDRYKKFAEVNVRNLKGYNKKVEETLEIEGTNEENLKKMPQIVIIVDELADLMMVAPGEVEDAIVRLSQLARAAGIHLVIATQRPSVNVITGLIKANVPSRIAFSVSSGVDSRTIIDMVGAEKLLGKGDMLFYPQGIPKPIRVQGAFISDEEVSSVVEFLKDQYKDATYDEEVTMKISSEINNESSSQASSERDDYFVDAGRFIIDKDKASIGMLQRVYKIGFNRAARIMDQLFEAGVVGPEEGTKPRKVLMTLDEFEQYVEEYV